MKTDGVTFKLRINIVPEKAFEELKQGAYVDVRNIKQLPDDIKLRVGIIKSDEFYTDGIRTCTAGELANTETKETICFHYYDDLNNLENVKTFINFLFGEIKNPDQGFLIGSKNLKNSNYSLPIFQSFYEEFTKRVKNLSVFREHLFKDSESNIHYSQKGNILNISSTFRENMGTNYSDLTSPGLLNNCYKEIKLANGDKLYINGTEVMI